MTTNTKETTEQIDGMNGFNFTRISPLEFEEFLSAYPRAYISTAAFADGTPDPSFAQDNGFDACYDFTLSPTRPEMCIIALRVYRALPFLPKDATPGFYARADLYRDVCADIRVDAEA